MAQSAPMYLEDLTVGQIFRSGTAAVETERVKAFAAEFDPQPFHLDEQAAGASLFGGLVASGWHTAAMSMRLFVEHYLSKVATLPSPGIDELRWLHPVRPGDVLRIRVSVLEATPSRSKPDRGMVRTLVEVMNHDDDVVMSMKPMNIIARRSKS